MKQRQWNWDTNHYADQLFGTCDRDIRVQDVLEMLHQKLTPKYVEMLWNMQYFLELIWGRESFLKTLSRFLHPDNDVTLTSFIDQGMMIKNTPAKPMIMVWFNGHFQDLISLIHEVLNHEKIWVYMRKCWIFKWRLLDLCLDKNNKEETGPIGV